MSRLQLSAIGSYSLGGGGGSASGAKAGDDQMTAGATGAGLNASLADGMVLSSSSQLGLSHRASLSGSGGHGDDDEAADGSFDADDADASAMLDDSMEDLHAGVAGRVATTEVDPYAAPDAARAAFYPSGLLGPPTSVEGDEDAEAQGEQRQSSEHDDSAQQHQQQPFGHEYGESTIDRRYDDAEADAGWAGSGGQSADADADAQYLEVERRRQNEAAEEDEAEEEEAAAAQRDLYDGQETPGRIGVGRTTRKRNRYDDEDDQAAEGEDDETAADDGRRRHSEPAEDDEQQSEDEAADHDANHKRRRQRYADDEGSGSESGSDRDEYDEHDRRSGDEQEPATVGDDEPAYPAASSSYLPPASAHASQFANYSPATPIHSARSHPSTGLPSSAAAASLSSHSNYAPTTPSHHHHHHQHPASASAAAGSYPVQSPSSSSPHHAAAASYAYSSPHHSSYASYSPSPHHHPHFGPTSPRIGPGGHWGGGGSVPFGSTSGASSPRQDTIASVTHRVEQLARSGRLVSLLQTVARCNAEVPGALGSSAAQPSSLVPDYAHMLSSSSSSPALSSSAAVNAARASSKSALIAIDQHLLRRYMLAVLDSDMIVRGVVYNKSPSMGLVINIAEILWPQDKASEVLARQQQAAQQLVAHMSTTQGADVNNKPYFSTAQHFFPPLSSFLGGINASTAAATAVALEADSNGGGGGTYATERALFANFEVLAIHGECHLAEMQAPSVAPAVAAAASAAAAPSAAAVPSSVSLDRFSVGDQVHALVISVDVHSEKVYLSMNQNRLRGNVANMYRLGVAKDREKEAAAAAAATTAANAAAAAASASEKTKDQPLPPKPASTAPPLFSEATFSALLTKLKPDLQDRIMAYGAGGAGPNVGAPVGTTSSAATAPSSVAGSAYGSYLASKAAASSNAHAQPPSSAAALKSRVAAKPPSASNAALSSSASGLGGSSSGTAPGLSLLGNPLLIAKARHYLRWLQDTPLFKNPQGVSKLTAAYRVNVWGSLLRRQNHEEANTYKNLRYAQNQAWAKESVVKGISLAKKGSFANALKCYSHALAIEPLFTQAFVARGAAYVLQGQLQKAIAEFEQALAIDPEQSYALTYLQAAREKLSGKANNASGTPPAPADVPATAAAAAGSGTPQRSGVPSAGSMQRGISGGTNAASSSSQSKSRSRNDDHSSRVRDKDRDRERDRGRERSRSSRKKSRKDDRSKSSSKRRTSSSHRRSHSRSSESDASSDSEAEAVAAARSAASDSDPLVAQQAAVLALYGESGRSRSKKRHKKDRKKSSSSRKSDSKKNKKASRSSHKSSDALPRSSSVAASANDLIVLTSSSSSSDEDEDDRNAVDLAGDSSGRSRSTSPPIEVDPPRQLPQHQRQQPQQPQPIQIESEDDAEWLVPASATAAAATADDTQPPPVAYPRADMSSPGPGVLSDREGGLHSDSEAFGSRANSVGPDFFNSAGGGGGAAQPASTPDATGASPSVPSTLASPLPMAPMPSAASTTSLSGLLSPDAATSASGTVFVNPFAPVQEGEEGAPEE